MIGWRKTSMSCFFHLHYPKSLLSFLLGFQTSSILWTGTSQSSHESSWTQAKHTMRHTLLGTNISDTQGTFEDDFPSPVWWDIDKRSLGNKNKTQILKPWNDFPKFPWSQFPLQNPTTDNVVSSRCGISPLRPWASGRGPKRFTTVVEFLKWNGDSLKFESQTHDFCNSSNWSLQIRNVLVQLRYSLINKKVYVANRCATIHESESSLSFLHVS